MSGPTSARRPANPLDRVGDALSDVAVWGLGGWTVVYHAGRALGLGTDLLLVVTAVATLAGAVLTRRHLSPTVTAWGLVRASSGATALAVAAVVLSGAAVAAQWVNQPSRYAVGWGLSLLAVVPLVRLVVTRDRSSRPSRNDSEGGGDNAQGATAGQNEALPGAAPGWTVGDLASSLGVVLTGATLAYVSLRTVITSADDVFYVNKAVFVAETGVIPLRDTMYSNQTLPALRGAGTAPVQSIEVLQGAIAHLLGLSAGTVVYLVTPAVISFLAVWAVWRLVRSWSRRAALAAFVVAIAYLLWGSKEGYGFGAFFIGRIWQGKAIFVCLALPLLYLGLTAWARHHRRYDALMLVALGATAVGLTSTATLVVPVIALGVSAALLLAGYRHWWGAALAAVYPIVSGAVVAVSNADGGEFGEVTFTSSEAFDRVIGTGLWGALGLVAILLAPWLARRGPTRVVIAAGSLSALVVMAPGMPTLVNQLTGAGPVTWRLMWVPAVPVLVGLLATVAFQPGNNPGPVASRARTVVAAAVPVALLALVALGGRWLWSPDLARFESAPSWKYDTEALTQADWIDQSFDGPGVVLAPWRVMRAISLSTARIHAVDPRVSYLSSLSEPAAAHAARITLSESMTSGRTPTAARLESDLRLVSVGYVCLDGSKPRMASRLTTIGWTARASKYGLTCYDKAN